MGFFVGLFLIVWVYPEIAYVLVMVWLGLLLVDDVDDVLFSGDVVFFVDDRGVGFSISEDLAVGVDG
ncbi:hypothetical protein, partial [Rhizobium brockwellii]|uniref:hypothetical protein n=1 Tax=Rhizobium brockwellii TaxID=3019932 RepID=UPI003F94ED20